MTDFLQLAHDRYSCRAFTDKPVEAEKIDALVEAAIAAPTAVNKQPWHLWVVEDADAVLSNLEKTDIFPLADAAAKVARYTENLGDAVCSWQLRLLQIAVVDNLMNISFA